MSRPEFTEEEIAAIEAEMARLKVDDVLLQTLVTLINLGARKAGLAAEPGEAAPERDLEQTKQAIDGARALIAAARAAPRPGARAGQGRAVAAADGLRAAFRRNAAGRANRPRKTRRDRGRRSHQDDSGSQASNRAVDSRRSYGGPVRAVVSLCLSPEGFFVSSFLSDYGALLAVVCALLAVAYGVVTTRSLLALSPGNETMQRLSAAIQEGAQAYLKRQYTVIGAVGVVLFIALIPLQNIEVAIGFAIGGSPPRRPASSA